MRNGLPKESSMERIRHVTLEGTVYLPFHCKRVTSKSKGYLLVADDRIL